MILWLFLLCWGSISAQNNETNEIGQSTEIRPHFSISRDLLEEFGALMEKFRDMETNQRDIQRRVMANENQILELREKVTTQVIFSAATGDGDTAIGPYNTDTTLIFRRVITNIGNAYNRATGIFAAPYAGVYYFTFFYHAGGYYPAFLTLYKNNQMIVDAHDHYSYFDTADNGGNAVFLQLQQGDQVYIRMKADTHVWGNDYVTTFSGFLVTKM